MSVPAEVHCCVNVKRIRADKGNTTVVKAQELMAWSEHGGLTDEELKSKLGEL